MSEYGTLTDYTTGEEIHPATPDERQQSWDALRTSPTGAFDLDGRTVFVAGGGEPDAMTVTHEDGEQL